MAVHKTETSTNRDDRPGTTTGTTGPNSLRVLVRDVRDALLATRDTVCLERARLVTEAWRALESSPAPLRRAKAFAHVLRHMTLDLKSNPIFAGNTSSAPRAWMLVPEHGFSGDTQVAIENDGLEEFTEGKIPPEILAFWTERDAGRMAGGSSGIGHLAVDLDRVVNEGLGAILAEVEALKEDGDEEQRLYREAMAIALRAVMNWAVRYAEAASSAANEESDPLRRACLERVAKACRQVPARPARDLFEGLQAMALVQLAIFIEGHGMSVSVGLPDRVLARFATVSVDEEGTIGLISAFLLKLSAVSLYGRGSKTQAITVGGVDHTGRDCCNVLTRCFLEACHRTRVGDPHLFLRWHAGMDERVKRKTIEMLNAGDSMPLLVHDDPTARGLIAAGLTPEDAWDYCVIGCNELGVPGRSMETATPTSGTILYINLLTEMLLTRPDPDAFRDMDALLADLRKTVRRRLRDSRQAWIKRKPKVAARVPTPFTSSLMCECVRRGKDLLMGMPYQIPSYYERGLTNAVNALCAIERWVFQERAFTLSELVTALRNNFSGAQGAAIRARLRDAPKWGNDDDRADRWALGLVEMREDVLAEIGCACGDAGHMVCHVVRSLHHLDGRQLGATPDGRLGSTAVADSIGAETGTASRGVTAVLNSVQKIDAARYYRGGYNLNITLSGSPIFNITRALVEGFFQNGGQELQVNCLDAGTLREAQAHPERHGDLVVRIAGFSARFVDLSEVEQRELIERAESCCQRTG